MELSLAIKFMLGPGGKMSFKQRTGLERSYNSVILDLVVT